MNNLERIAVFLIRLVSLGLLIYFLAIAIVMAATRHFDGTMFMLGPAALALLLYFSARFLARLIAGDLG